MISHHTPSRIPSTLGELARKHRRHALAALSSDKPETFRLSLYYEHIAQARALEAAARTVKPSQNRSTPVTVAECRMGNSMNYIAESNKILATGQPRSEAYRQGLVRQLEVRHRKETGQAPLTGWKAAMPYPIGSAELDAFLAGAERGRIEWELRYTTPCDQPVDQSTSTLANIDNSQGGES